MRSPWARAHTNTHARAYTRRLMLDILFNIFFAFFMGQWEEYHTGLMNTNNGYVGITEGQGVQILILLVTAGLGGEAWDRTLFTLPLVSKVCGLLGLWTARGVLHLRSLW